VPVVAKKAVLIESDDDDEEDSTLPTKKPEPVKSVPAQVVP